MGLISCPECGRQGVSDQAEACPGCGFSLSELADPAEAPAGESQRALSAGLLTGARVTAREKGRKLASGSLVVRDGALFVDGSGARVSLCSVSEVLGLSARGPRVTLQLAERTLTVRFLTHLTQELARRKAALSDLVGRPLPAERAERPPRRGFAFVLVVVIAIGAVSLWNRLQHGVEPVPAVDSPAKPSGAEGRVDLPEERRRRIYARAEALRLRARQESGGGAGRYEIEDRYLAELAKENGLTLTELEAVVLEGQRQQWPAR